MHWLSAHLNRGVRVGMKERYGSLAVHTQVNFVDDPVNGFMSGGDAGATASFDDTITILGGPVDQGWILPQFNLPAQYSDFLEVSYLNFLPWQRGVPVSFFASLTAIAEASSQPYRGQHPLNDANLILQQLLITDIALNPISAVTYTTASGVPYNVPGGTIAPEPDTVWLLAGGLAWFAFRRRLRSRLASRKRLRVDHA